MNATVCNPLLRTPLSLIIDDSCPVINLTYYWMHQWLAWRPKHRPDLAPASWEGNPRVPKLSRTIPVDFAKKWGEWCGEQGIRGKFSFIPFPAGQGRIDQGFPEHPRHLLPDWLKLTKETIWPNFDLTPEMLTHSHVVDLKTWQLTPQWEQVEWVSPPVELLTDYIAAAMQLLKNVGIPCEGVTSPGAFGKRKEEAYSKAILDAALRVNNNPRPVYFLWLDDRKPPSVPLWHVQKDKGIAIASIWSCAGDWFGSWTGFDKGDPDRFITEDLKGGRLPAVLEKELPCVLCGHWPGFYFEGDEFGFGVLKTVKKRLDAYDPDKSKTLWMKNSEIGHYWMARQLFDIAVADNKVTVTTKFPTENFTLKLADWVAKGVKVGGAELRQAASRRDFRSGTFLVEGRDTFAAFVLKEGATALEVLGEGTSGTKGT
ncbi:MAG: hypothetical protein FJ291_01715 [Planctomycetes bacterium]|nr:hypothetical protein [Planctomycetota bacterium]